MYHMNKKILLLCVAVVMVVALLSLKEAKAENTLNVREFVMIEGFTPIERMRTPEFLSSIDRWSKVLLLFIAVYVCAVDFFYRIDSKRHRM